MRWESKPLPDATKVKAIQEALQVPETIATLLNLSKFKLIM